MKKILTFIIFFSIGNDLYSQTQDTCLTKIQIINIAQKLSFSVNRITVLQTLLDEQDSLIVDYKKLHEQDSLEVKLKNSEINLLNKQVEESLKLNFELEKKSKKQNKIIIAIMGALGGSILIAIFN